MPKLPIIFIVVGGVICAFALVFGLKIFPDKYQAKIMEVRKIMNITIYYS
jgi:hypothetical protein